MTHQRALDSTVLAWTAFIAFVWLAAAFLRDETTLHLGPLLLPVVPMIVGRDNDRPVTIAAYGVIAGAAVITILSATGNLDGPALSPFGDALTESIAFLAVGAVVALIVGALRQHRG